MPTVVPPALNPPTPNNAGPVDKPLTSFAVDLAALLRTMPNLSTTARERADWFDRKADLLERVASDNRGCDPVEVWELARAARVKADELRREGS